MRSPGRRRHPCVRLLVLLPPLQRRHHRAVVRLSYKAPKKIVVKAARAAQSFAVVHDDLDLDVAQAHVDGAVEAMLSDPPMFNRAVKAADGDADAARRIVGAFFGAKV